MDEGLEVGTEYWLIQIRLTCRGRLGVVKESPYSQRKKDMISQKAFNTWLQNSKSGDRITYYRGYLCDPYLQPIAATADRDRVKKLGKSVLAVAEAGLLFLTQKRHDDFDYEYIAVRK